MAKENETTAPAQEGSGISDKDRFIVGLMVAALLVMAFTQFQIGNVTAAVGGIAVLQQNFAAGAALQPQAASGQPLSSGASGGATAAGGGGAVDLKLLEGKVLAKGVPDAYGAKLGISYDDVEGAMAVLTRFDDGNPMADAALNARYVKIAGAISCEYCCGANSIIFPDGKAACGCAHSYAMRGLAKYLLANNPQISDEKILGELSKWKSLFFPQQSMAKAVQFQLAGKDINPIDLMGNKYRGFVAPASAAPTSGGAAQGGVGSYAKQVGGC